MEAYQEKNIVKAIKKRKKILFFLPLLIFILSFIKISLFPIYETSAVILIDYPKKEPTSTESEFWPLREYISYVGTQASLITSRPVIEKVIEDFGLIKLNAKERKKQLEKIIKKFQNKYVSVKTSPLSPLVTITVQYSDSEMAAGIANKIIQIYKDWNTIFQHSEIDKLIEYLDTETKLSKERLRDSEENLRKFREKNEIIALPEQIRTYLQNILEDLKVHYQVVKETKMKLLELEVELSRMRELYTDNSPQVIYTKERIALVKDKLNKEIRKYRANKSYLEKLKYIPEKEIILDSLTRDVKINEAQYIFLSGEIEKAQLLRAKQAIENIKLISSAVAPLEPKEGVSYTVLNTLVGLIMTFAIILISEVRSFFTPY